MSRQSELAILKSLILAAERGEGLLEAWQYMRGVYPRDLTGSFKQFVDAVWEMGSKPLGEILPIALAAVTKADYKQRTE